MRINLFKAARRIAVALGVSWVGGCIVYGVIARPHAHLSYSIGAPGTAPVRVDRCGRDDGSRFILAKNVEGHPIGVLLCFKTLKAKSARWWAGGTYTPEVERQMSALEESFRLPPEGVKEAERIHQEQRLEQWNYAAIAAVSGLAVGWVLVVIVGWLARGVLDIPAGKNTTHSLQHGTSSGTPRSRLSLAEDPLRVKRRTKRYE